LPEYSLWYKLLSTFEAPQLFCFKELNQWVILALRGFEPNTVFAVSHLLEVCVWGEWREVLQYPIVWCGCESSIFPS